MLKWVLDFQANCNKNIAEVHEQSPSFPGWNTALVHQIKAITVRSLLQQTTITCEKLPLSILKPLWFPVIK